MAPYYGVLRVYVHAGHLQNSRLRQSNSPHHLVREWARQELQFPVWHGRRVAGADLLNRKEILLQTHSYRYFERAPVGDNHHHHHQRL